MTIPDDLADGTSDDASADLTGSIVDARWMETTGGGISAEGWRLGFERPGYKRLIKLQFD